MMRILGAGTAIPAANPDRWRDRTPKPPLACPRPEASRGSLAFELALPVAREVLKQAGVRPSRLDLILSFGISPSHIVDEPDIVGPRVSHPLQREIAATNAYVFDVSDAEWGFAIDVARGFAAQQHYERVLLVKSDLLSLSVAPDNTTGFAVPDGVGILLLDASGAGDGAWRTTYTQLDSPAAGLAHESYARLDLVPREQMAGTALRGQLRFPIGEADVAAIDRVGREILAREAAACADAAISAESWFPGHLEGDIPRRVAPTVPYLGPFTLPAVAASLLANRRGPSPLVSLTMSPFHLYYAAQVLCI